MNNNNNDYRNYKPAHSNLLIHWTGFDIDCKSDEWESKPSSETNEKDRKLYLDRLIGILKFGLWMTKNEEDKFLKFGEDTNGENKIERPWAARTCFTELKLSEVRNHASRYGRLGIGFKRPFLFKRLGSPMVYYQSFYENNWFLPPFLSEYGKSDYFSCFLKKMSEKSREGRMVFKYFDESEWRIIYSDKIEEHFQKIGKTSISKYFKKVDNNDPDFNEYLNKQQGTEKPEYLIPLIREEDQEQWLSIIIYPSLDAKVEAESNEEIRDLLNKIKPKKSYGNNISSPANCEKYSKPMEIDLDSCRNF